MDEKALYIYCFCVVFSASFDNEEDITEFVKCKIESLVANEGNTVAVEPEEETQNREGENGIPEILYGVILLDHPQYSLFMFTKPHS